MKQIFSVFKILSSVCKHKRTNVNLYVRTTSIVKKGDLPGLDTPPSWHNDKNFSYCAMEWECGDGCTDLLVFNIIFNVFVLVLGDKVYNFLQASSLIFL